MAENEHDENLIDDIMRGGPNYCLDRIESLETEVSRLQARVAELEAMWVEERAARLWADDIVRYEGHLTWSEVDARTRSHCIEEARAALQRTGSQAAPKSEIESTLRAGLDLCHYEIDRAINQAAPSEDGDDAADIALARRARWGIVDDGAGQR